VFYEAWLFDSGRGLRDTKLIAKAWDAAGAYQGVAFPIVAGRNGTAIFVMMCVGSGAAMRA
jgi:hypothetical protein